MTLTEKDYKEFLLTHLDLLFYVGRQLNIIPSNTTIEKFVKLDLNTKFECREALLSNEKLLDDYLSLNFDRLTTDQIKTLTGFKKKIKSDFVIFKCLTNNAIFIDTRDNKFYAVKALGDPFDNFFGDFPVLVSTTLLPYNERIIYDGFIQSAGVYCGKEMTRTMNTDYQLAKKRKEILTTIE
jgi:hypothetical protein